MKKMTYLLKKVAYCCWPSEKKGTFLWVVALALVTGFLMSWQPAYGQCLDTDPTVPVGITPTKSLVGNPPLCPGGVRINDPASNTYNLGSDGTVTIVVSQSPSCGSVFSWEVSPGIEINLIVAKGGPEANVYDYTGVNPRPTFDGNLHATVGPSGNYYGLSHIDFCYIYVPPFECEIVVDNDVTCYGGDDGQATVSVTGGVPPYTYLWSDGQTTATAGGLAAGNYSVTVTDNDGRTTQCFVTISQPPFVPVNLMCGSDVVVIPCVTQEELELLFAIWLNSFSVSGGTGVVTVTYTVNGEPVELGDLSAPDICGGSITIVAYAIDECEVTATCQGTFTVVGDDEPPVFADCPVEDVDLGCNPEMPDEDLAIFYAGEVTDNCGVVNTWAVPGPVFQVDCEFTQTWTVYAIDYCENVASCEVTFVWVEAEEPEWLYTEGQLNQTFECGADALAYLGGLLDMILTGEQFVGCFDDIDESLLLTESTLDGDINCEFELTLTYTLTDICGQQAHFVVVLSVEYAPLVVPANLVEEVDCYDDVEQRDPVDVFDGCDELLDAELILTEDTFDGCEGVVTYTWLYTDCAGNTGTWQQIVTILPATDLAWDQELLPADLTLECTDDVPAMVVLTASNNCEAVLVTVASSIVYDEECPYAYVITRSWSVEDACGNTLFHEQVITVQDTQAPELVNGLPEYLTFECNEEVILPVPEFRSPLPVC
jgi:hypothetical protein